MAKHFLPIFDHSLWERLSVVEIPLRPGDTDVPLELQTLVEMCYRNGGYDGTLNYAADPNPPLTRADLEWAADWLH